MIDGKQVKNASLANAKFNLSTPTLPQDPTRKDYVDAVKSYTDTQIAAVNASLSALNQGRAVKEPVRAATTANITLSATQTVDGVSLVVGDRVLVKNQTTASANGIYVVSATAWLRSIDSDTSAKVSPGMYVYVNEGTINADTGFALVTDGTIVLNTTNLTFSILNLLLQIVPVTLNRNMAALTTISDGDPACASTLAKTPTLDGDVSVSINGVLATIGDGIKTKDCYFSADLGATARLIKDISSGDKLYWVGSVAGYQLANTDLIDVQYNA